MVAKLTENPEAKKKADDYWKTYLELKSVHKTADAHGTSHSAVHRHLKAFGYRLKGEKFTKQDDQKIIAYYMNTPASSFDLDYLTKELGRGQKTNVSRRAGELGLTDKSRIASTKQKARNSTSAKEAIKQHGHPKGFLGKKHTQEVRELISENTSKGLSKLTEDDWAAKNLKQAQTKEKNGTLYPARRKASWKQQWAEVGGVRNFYRSQWELNYAHYLEWLKQKGQILKWEHEPETFWFEGVKRGTCSYLPDFRVTESDGSIVYHEVKGWMDDRSKTKIKRMAIYHPGVKLIVIDAKAYKSLARKAAYLVDGWA